MRVQSAKQTHFPRYISKIHFMVTAPRTAKEDCMKQIKILKALSDQTRLDILKLLLAHNYCAKALSRKLAISEAAVSQHLKLLREVDLLKGEKKGYFIHYTVNRTLIQNLGKAIIELAQIEQSSCSPKQGGCHLEEIHHCHIAICRSTKEKVR